MAAAAKKTKKFNGRQKAIIAFALEFLKSNLNDEIQKELTDNFQAVSGPDEDPHGAEDMPSEVEENEIDGLIRRIEQG